MLILLKKDKGRERTEILFVILLLDVISTPPPPIDHRQETMDGVRSTVNNLLQRFSTFHLTFYPNQSTYILVKYFNSCAVFQSLSMQYTSNLCDTCPMREQANDTVALLTFLWSLSTKVEVGKKQRSSIFLWSFSTWWIVKNSSNSTESCERFHALPRIHSRLSEENMTFTFSPEQSSSMGK